MKITAQMIVKNEDQFIWFAIQSVLPYVEKMIIFDTGSSDKTVEVIQSIRSSKIIFEQITDYKDLSELRNKQLSMTKTEWFLLVDGDEIWPEKQLKKLIATAADSRSVSAFFNRTRNAVGDVFHYLPDDKGQYIIKGMKGHFNMRLIKKTADLKVKGIYPLEFYENSEGPLQNQDQNIEFVDCWYLHTSFLRRSSVTSKTSGSLGKAKLWERGIDLDKKELPEVLFETTPKLVSSPLEKRTFLYELIAMLLMPVITIKGILE